MTDPQQQQQQQRTRRGCLFYGCIVGVVFMLMVLAGLLYGIHQFKRMLTEFTDSKPMAVPTVSLSQAQIDALHQRVNTFSNAVTQGKEAAPLVLNSDEVNALLQSNAGNQGMKGNVYISLPGDKVKAEVSLPMGQTGLPFSKNRYLNGDASLDVSLRNGMLGVYIDQINVKGKPLPKVYMDRLRMVNWAEAANTNRQASSALNKLQSIEVKDSKLIITPAEPEKRPQ